MPGQWPRREAYEDDETEHYRLDASNYILLEYRFEKAAPLVTFSWKKCGFFFRYVWESSVNNTKICWFRNTSIKRYIIIQLILAHNTINTYKKRFDVHILDDWTAPLTKEAVEQKGPPLSNKSDDSLEASDERNSSAYCRVTFRLSHGTEIAPYQWLFWPVERYKLTQQRWLAPPLPLELVYYYAFKRLLLTCYITQQAETLSSGKPMCHHDKLLIEWKIYAWMQRS